MSANRDLERRLVAFYDAEPPTRAPAWVLEAALSTIETTNQRRGLLAPWRLPTMNGFPRLAAVVIAVAALAAVGFAVLFGSGGPSTVLPSAPSSPATTGPPAVPTGETAAAFRPSFTYVLPSEVRFDYGPRTSDFFEFRVPDSGGVGQAAWFVDLLSAENGRAFPCATTPGRVPIADAQRALEYLKSVPTVTVSGETTTEVDGRTALTASLTLAKPDGSCPQLSLWMSDEGEGVPELFRDPATAFRVTLLEVDGTTIAIHTIATREAIDGFRWADELIGSFHFQP